VLAIALVSVSATAWAGIDYGPWLTGVTQNAITVKWGSADAAGMVEYGATDALGQEADTVYANGVQEADLTSLATGTRYYYRVTSGGDTSDIHSFLTAPDENAAFHFAVISDTQGDISVYHSIAEALLPTEPEFVLHNGDLVSYPFLDSQWTNFWSVTDLVAGDAPYFPVRGNHDGLPGGKQHFELYWSDPMNEGTVSRSSYSFQYGNTYFVALDINEPYFAGSAQHQWLEDQLAYAKSLPSVKHCIVHAHFPPYSCSHHGNDPDVLAFRASVTPLFEKYDIDLYMSGHDHTYQRSVVNGLTYLVTGCSASDQYDCNPQAWTVVCEKTANYSYIVIDGDEISVEAHRPDNSLIDSFTIDHNYHGDVDDDTVDDDVTDDDATDDDAIDDDATDDDVDDDATDDDGGDDDAGGCGC
jgi:predicted phosphodiesterase